MTWTYTGDPCGSQLDAIRFAIGDTDSTDPLLTDEELNYLLKQSGGATQAAALSACRRLLAKFARCVDTRTGDIDVKYSQRIEHIKTQMEMIRQESVPTPYAGGIRVSDIENVQDDEDRQGPQFAIGMFDNPVDDPLPTGGTGGVI